ncbi:MAG TPA: UPF0175 family protein [Ktedonobacterales bacterium]
MSLLISDDLLRSIHMSADELRREIAVMLFQQERLTLGQASQLAGVTQFAFQGILAERQIPIHYGVAEFEEDMQTLREQSEQ